jgi:hypothetical protein
MNRRGFLASIATGLFAPLLKPFLCPEHSNQYVKKLLELPPHCSGYIATDTGVWYCPICRSRHRGNHHCVPDPGYSHSMSGNLPICPPGWVPCNGQNVGINDITNT